MESTIKTGKKLSKRPRLKKELGFYELLIIGIAGSLGNGALFGTIDMVAGAGPSAILAFVFGAFIYLLVTFTYVELSRVYPEAGGPTRYSIYTHGRWTNLINSMADILWYLFIPPIEVVAIIIGSGFFFPGLFVTSSGFPTFDGGLLGVVLLLTFIPINYFGIKQFGKTSNWIGVVKLVFYLAMVIGLIGFVFDAKNLFKYGFFTTHTPIVSFLSIMPLAMYDFGATRVIPDLAEETRHKADVTKAMIFTVIIESLIYIGVAFAIILGFHWSSFGVKPGDFAALTSAHALVGLNPFFVFSQRSGFYWIFIAALITGFLAPYVTGYIYAGSGSRVMMAIGRSGFINKRLQSINLKHSIPLVALVSFTMIGAIIVFLSAPIPSIYSFIDDASAAGYLGLAVTPIALMVSRRQGVTKETDKFRGMWIIAPLSVGLSSLIPFWAGWPSEPYAVFLMFIGAAMIGIISKVKIGARNAIWYVVYILFITLMTLIGSDGFAGTITSLNFASVGVHYTFALSLPASWGTLIPFDYATLLIFVISMAVFYPWGVLSGFKAQFDHPEFTRPVLDDLGIGSGAVAENVQRAEEL
ncbi:MAG: APC family permease [Candidatus Thermoplasmatota archaeon]|nr:APC family permease [Candidatus Thermoplasmatota archaeon]MCL5888957.1 APC family permease [Candidatus Thermoplasmatota archaeon]